jgi:CheY-like chemotaxis protein
VFVTSAIQSDFNENTRDSIREDAKIISASLRFINELLRNILDVQRATRDRMELEMDLIDILHDVFQPTASMIYSRDTNFQVEVDCPAGLVVRSDKLRLQQVVLNLARNSAKFVVEGFIRLRAEVVNDSVHLYIEDSGPGKSNKKHWLCYYWRMECCGRHFSDACRYFLLLPLVGIPKERRGDLFNKYQKSLDVMSQGTGVGLSLVEKLVRLMDGSIWLDESYISGHRDFPGARLVIDLNQPASSTKSGNTGVTDLDDAYVQYMDFAIPEHLNRELPDKYKVLLVDDDRTLRKLARRVLWQIRPDWEIHEAASGEACLHLCETEVFDIIFMDQYMCSVEQSLKGRRRTMRLIVFSSCLSCLDCSPSLFVDRY